MKNENNDSNWKDQLPPNLKNFLTEYGSPNGETYKQFLKRYSGQNFLDSSQEEQEKLLFNKYNIHNRETNIFSRDESDKSKKEVFKIDDWVDVLTEDQKNFYSNKKHHNYK